VICETHEALVVLARAFSGRVSNKLASSRLEKKEGGGGRGQTFGRIQISGI